MASEISVKYKHNAVKTDIKRSAHLKALILDN